MLLKKWGRAERLCVERRRSGERFGEFLGDRCLGGDAEGAVVEELEEDGGGFGGDDEAVLGAVGISEEGGHHIDEDACFGTRDGEGVSGVLVECGHGVDFDPLLVGGEFEGNSVEYLLPESDGEDEDFAEVEFSCDVVDYCGEGLFGSVEYGGIGVGEDFALGVCEMKKADWEVRIQIEADEILFVLYLDDSLLAEPGQDFFIFDELHQ